MNLAKGRRKLLTAALGVATISYVYACGDTENAQETPANVAPPQTHGAGGASQLPPTSGNLPAPPPPPPTGSGGATQLPPTSGNLPAPPPPPPPDAGTDRDSGTAEDAGADASAVN